ncbi:MAG: helix-turn-helix domain-containing protein [Clostridia bacterium]|nr:helix-turn-helix domain-containing protein [Clostridia bacterium]MDE7256611.1 helix-turn-helix domain-containing protein [Clostridia bacterium]
MKSFQDRLKELREENGLSQSQLAKETNLSQAAISLWEDGQRIPNAQVIIILARYFKVSTDYLLGVTD